MIYPNESISLGRLEKMVNDEDYILYYEMNEEAPKGYDFSKYGIYRGERREIKNHDELMTALSKQLSGEGKFCYDVKDSYYKKHPYMGEEGKIIISKSFKWEWQSSYTGKCYSITESSYLGEAPKHKGMSLKCHEDDFNSSCFAIGIWDYDEHEECYEFRSVGYRFMDNIDEHDIPFIWKGMQGAEKFLKEELGED